MEGSAQIAILDKHAQETFEQKINDFGFEGLVAQRATCLQVNLGYMCNQTCNHCHVDAGPNRTEKMSKAHLEKCLEILEAHGFSTLDVTGGAPEMHPHFRWFTKRAAEICDEVIVRSNLTFLVQNKTTCSLVPFFRENKLRIVSSLPCYTKENVDGQRGAGVFERSIEALQLLNEAGYGRSPELILDLVYNPTGASLPGVQAALEADYKRNLKSDFGLSFNKLFTITNMPISRFLDFLLASDRLEEYMGKLIESFNPSTLSGLMCQETISVDWEGNLYDCDFNQMLEIPIQNGGTLDQFDSHALENRLIRTEAHCFGCTAGAGSSCQGSLD